MEAGWTKAIRLPPAPGTGVSLISRTPRLLRSASSRSMSSTWMATWWMTEAVEIEVTSLLPIAAFPLLGVMSVAKTTANYVNSILAKREATSLGYDEALMLDTDGYVAEASGENIFIVTDGVLRTPPVTAVLSGITRASIITLAQDLGITVRDDIFSRDELYLADEAFLRRIPNKIFVDAVDDEVFDRIFAQLLKTRKLTCSAEAPAFLRNLCHELAGELRACQPADVIDILVSVSEFEGSYPAVTTENLSRAARLYFTRPKVE